MIYFNLLILIIFIALFILSSGINISKNKKKQNKEFFVINIIEKFFG